MVMYFFYVGIVSIGSQATDECKWRKVIRRGCLRREAFFSNGHLMADDDSLHIHIRVLGVDKRELIYVVYGFTIFKLNEIEQTCSSDDTTT